MNLILHGLDGNVRLGDSLLNDQHPSLKADIVIANPPFNLRSGGAGKVDGKDERLQVHYERGEITDSNANYMWMLHFFLHHLADGGTADYVMANGAMTTNTTEEKATRTALVEEGFVDCIVQLPDKLFFGTGIPCCLWLLSKNRRGTHGHRFREEEILFIDARGLGELVSRRQRALVQTEEKDEISRIADLYRRYKRYDVPDDEPGFCKIATVDEVRAYDYKLTPGIYVGTQAADEDEEPFEEKMPRLTAELRELFAKSDAIQAQILADLDTLP